MKKQNKIRVAILLMAIALVSVTLSCKKGDSSSGGNSGGSATGELDPELVGAWSQSYTSTIDYTDGGGSYSQPSGVQVALRFYSDGRFESDFFNQSSLYSCTITILGLRTGKHHIDHTDGKTMYIDELTSTLKTTDNCHVANNGDKTIALKKIKYAYYVAVDPADNHVKLHLKTASGEDDVFYKVN